MRQENVLGRLVMVVGLAIVGLASGKTRGEETDTLAIEPVGDVEMVRGGFQFTEGPAWDPVGKRVFFTDIPNNKIHAIDQNDQLETFTDASGHANGLIITASGELLACEMDGQVVAWDLKTRQRKVMASQFAGVRFNACNDLVMDSSGGIYFTDPLFRAPTPLPQTIQAVYYRSSGGEVTRISGEIAAPNGIALSPDEKHLYIAPSHQAAMLVCAVEAPGEISEAEVFCELRQPIGKTNSGGDGMAVDVAGNLYFTTHFGVEIFSPAGEAIGLVSFPEQPANVTFVGADRKTLLVTARKSLYRVKMSIAGLPPLGP